MKKMTCMYLAMILLLGILFSCSPASAAKIPNTKADLRYLEIDWYTDYATFMKKMKSETKVFDDESIVQEYFGTGDVFAPDYQSIITGNTVIEKDCAGYIRVNYNSSGRKIFGYWLKYLDFYFMWDPKVATDGSEEAKNASRLYMVSYTVGSHGSGNNKTDADYFLTQMKFGYGDDPVKVSMSAMNSSGSYFDVDAYRWIDENKASINYSADKRFFYVVMCAPDFDEELDRVRNAMR